MNNIIFEPWVGKNYATTGYQGKKILVLGESHYCINELAKGGRCYPICKKEQMNNACFSFTQVVVRKAVYGYQGDPELRCFVTFERAVAGKELSQQEREAFWEKVVFYNYVQYALPAPGISPNKEHLGKSQKLFLELLEKYMPDYIIVWGARLYNRLPECGGHALKLDVSNEYTADVWVYPINGKNIPALKIYHPSMPRGKNWHFWHEVIDIFLNNN